MFSYYVQGLVPTVKFIVDIRELCMCQCASNRDYVAIGIRRYLFLSMHSSFLRMNLCLHEN